MPLKHRRPRKKTIGAEGENSQPKTKTMFIQHTQEYESLDDMDKET